MADQVTQSWIRWTAIKKERQWEYKPGSVPGELLFRLAAIISLGDRLLDRSSGLPDDCFTDRTDW